MSGSPELPEIPAAVRAAAVRLLGCEGRELNLAPDQLALECLATCRDIGHGHESLMMRYELRMRITHEGRGGLAEENTAIQTTR